MQVSKGRTLVFFGGTGQNFLDLEGRTWFEPDAPVNIQLGLPRDGEELKSRMERAGRLSKFYLDYPSCSIVDVAYSMGCYPAVEFISGLPSSALARLILIAPDPKYRKNQLDEREERAGQTSVFAQACEVWGDPPGDGFCKELQDIVARSSPEVCEIQFSEDDSVALFPGNLEKLQAALPGAAWRSTTLDNIDRMTARCEDWIHDEMLRRWIRTALPLAWGG